MDGLALDEGDDDEKELDNRTHDKYYSHEKIPHLKSADMSYGSPEYMVYNAAKDGTRIVDIPAHDFESYLGDAGIIGGAF